MCTGRNWLGIGMGVGLLILGIVFYNPEYLHATIYGKISGRVINEDTGEGLKDVFILLYHYNNNRFYNVDEIYTDKNGKFVFNRIPEGRYSLIYRTDWTSGYFINKTKDIDQDIIKINTFIVKKGQHYRVVKRALLVGELRVAVKNSNGTVFTYPSEFGFDIQLFGEPGERYVAVKNPARPGEYYLRLPAGTYRCEVQVYGYPTQKAKDIRIEKGKIEAREFTVDLNDSTGIEGRVISSEDGSPISEILMAIYAENSDEEICTVRTDENGGYIVVGLLPGEYRIYCAYPYKSFKGIMVTKGKKTWFEIKIEDDQAESVQSISSSGTISYRGPFFFDNSEANASYFNNEKKYLFPDIFKGLYVNGNLVNIKNYSEYEDVFFKYFRGAIRKGRGLGGSCLPEEFHNTFVRNLRNPNKYFEVGLKENRDYDCGEIPPDRQEVKVNENILINLFIVPPISDEHKKNCGCNPEPTIFHELLHLLLNDKYVIVQECAIRACEKNCYPDCATEVPEWVGDKTDWRKSERCWRKDDKGNYIWKTDCSGKKAGSPSPQEFYETDNPDDNYSFSTPQVSADAVYESSNPSLLVMKSGYWEKAGVLLNVLNIPFSYIEPDQSPMEMSPPVPLILIPSGGLMGLEKSSQLQNILSDYVLQGGTILVFSQQHGYEYAVLPRPDGKTVGAYGWREDQSCWTKSIYVDNWHPALTSVTNSDISVPVDGYVFDYPENATVLLRRTRNGEPALVTWKTGIKDISSENHIYI